MFKKRLNKAGMLAAVTLAVCLLLAGCAGLTRAKTGAAPSAPSSSADSSSDQASSLAAVSALSSSSRAAVSSPASSAVSKPAASRPAPSGPSSSSQPVAAKKTVRLIVDATKGGGGMIANDVAVEYRSGDTAYTVLNRYCKSKNILSSPRDAKGTVYVDNIAGVSPQGAQSGWIYFVNGKFYLTDANALKVKADDTVRWVYTLDLGKSEGANAS